MQIFCFIVFISQGWNLIHFNINPFVNESTFLEYLINSNISECYNRNSRPTNLHHPYEFSEPVGEYAEALEYKGNWVYLASTLPHFVHKCSSPPVKNNLIILDTMLVLGSSYSLICISCADDVVYCQLTTQHCYFSCLNFCK